MEVHDEAAREGSCRLLTYDGAPLCEPPCDWSATCDDGTCVPLAAPQSAGTLELVGVEATPISIPVSGTGLYEWHTDTLSVEQLSAVTLSAPGDAVPGFSLATCVAQPPEPTGDWVALLQQREPGEDVVLLWSNPIATARIYLRMTTGIGSHGCISPFEIECEGPDTGTLTLPGSFLDQLYSAGWTCGKCGNNDLWRYHASETSAGAKTLQLRTQSATTFWYAPNAL